MFAVATILWIVSTVCAHGTYAASLKVKPLFPSGFDERYPEEVPGLFQGDIELPEGNLFSRNAVGDKHKRWPNGTVPYTVHSYFSDYEKKMIHKALRKIEDDLKVDGKNCITFINKTTEKKYLFFATGVGCHSQVGFSGKTQGVSLGIGCRSKGTVMHETLHALGFYHEQSRPDRDSFVKVVTENIQKKHLKNFEKLFPPVISTQELDYDYDSIMHYDAFSFGIDREKPTLVPLRKSATIGQRYGLSQLDVVQLQRLYGCREKTLINVQGPDVVSVNCTFDGGLCGWLNIPIPGPNNNTWIRSRDRTLSSLTGPDADHTFGTFQGYYLFTEASDNYFGVARVQTPLMSPGQNCLTFWYHMRGHDMGTLNVFQIKEHQKNKITLFTISGHQGKKWKQAKLNVFAEDQTKIEFESITGPHFRSDMAIDDVSAHPGLC